MKGGDLLSVFVDNMDPTAQEKWYSEHDIHLLHDIHTKSEHFKKIGKERPSLFHQCHIHFQRLLLYHHGQKLPAFIFHSNLSWPSLRPSPSLLYQSAIGTLKESQSKSCELLWLLLTTGASCNLYTCYQSIWSLISWEVWYVCCFFRCLSFVGVPGRRASFDMSNNTEGVNNRSQLKIVHVSTGKFCFLLYFYFTYLTKRHKALLMCSNETYWTHYTILASIFLFSRTQGRNHEYKSRN